MFNLTQKNDIESTYALDKIKKIFFNECPKLYLTYYINIHSYITN